MSPMNSSILIVEDDPDIARLIKIHLIEANYLVDLAVTGPQGLEMARNGQYGLIILDLMLPGMSGTDICKAVRSSNSDVRILILTVKSALVDKVLGLELGADDYMTKPFDIVELVARVRALLRRGSSGANGNKEKEAAPESGLLIRGPVTMDRNRHKVWVRDELLELTPKQFDLLYFLASSPGRAYSRQDLLNHVWQYDSSGYEHTVDSHINRLRAKIELDPGNPALILTVWGIGYKFAENL